MSTLATLLQALAAARRAGEDFDRAWEAASAQALGVSCNAGDWQPVLDTTRDGWEAAYRRLPATQPERALTLLVEDLELADEADDPCRRCGQPIPSSRGKRAPALYCSDRCRRAWHADRRDGVAA
jgi:hypothetical protein